MGVLRVNVGAVRAKLAKIAAGLRAAATGAVVDEAAAAVQALIDGASQAIIARHTDTGKAAGERGVQRSGGLVVLSWPRYLAYHQWNPFRSRMPAFVVKAASVIFARALIKALGGRGKPGGEIADAIAAAADETDAKKAAKAARRQEREDKKIDRQIKAREERAERKALGVGKRGRR